MKNILLKFREKIIGSAEEDDDEDKDINNLIALGVLLWVVAEADDQFLPEESEQIKEVLNQYSDIDENDLPIVLRSIEEAAAMRIDVHSFTREVSKGLERPAKIEIIEHLFRVACVDQDLAESEHEAIRLISSLFRLEHKEFINSKIKIKKEFGMDTAGL